MIIFYTVLIVATIINVTTAMVCHWSVKQNEKLNTEMLDFMDKDFDRMVALVEKSKMLAKKVGVEC